MRPTTTPRLAVLQCGLLAALLIFAAGCDSGPGESLYDPDPTTRPDPAVTAVSPAPTEIVLAGIDEVTLTGTNFSATASENLVYFNDVRAEILEASPTALRVKAPNVPLPDLEIRVAVLGAENYSNLVPYRLVSAVEPLAEIGAREEPTGFGADDMGNAYASMFSEGSSVGIDRFSPEGERSDYFTTTFPWSDLEVGPDGALYGVRGVQAVFRLPEGMAQQTYQVVTGSARLSSLDFGPNGALWSGSREGNVYRVAPGGGSFDQFDLPGNIQDLVVFDGALYVAVTQDNVSRVVRFPIDSNGDLDEAETYIDVTATFAVEARALAFAQDGTLFIGTDGGGFSVVEERNPVVIVLPDGSSEVLYPGVLGPAVSTTSVEIRGFAWDASTGLYAIRRFETRGQVIEIFFDLVRIETRKMGA
jgi:hypothetical protein